MVPQSVQNDTTFDEYAVIDLGSNSFHMVVARHVNGSFQILNRIKQQARLAAGLNKNKELDQESIDRGVVTLSLFAERLKNFPPENVKIVGTHSLRVARNRNEFLKAAAQVLPYPIEVISGQEEARLIYFGVVQTEPTHDLKLVIDIGGGSTELAMGTDIEPNFVDSRPMGCVTYTQQFFPEQKITPQAFKRATLAAEQQLEKIALPIQKSGAQIAFGASGTIKCIYNILLDMGVEDGIITTKRLNDLISYVFEFKTFDEINFPSLSAERRPLFVAGLAILTGLFNALKLKEMHYTQSALREGVLYEMTEQFSELNVRQRTALGLSAQYSIDNKHANKVVNTTKHLYQQWSKQVPSTLANPTMESILYWAALLHEVGLNINYSGIQKHSAYILQNSNMPGFNEEQQLLLATLVRFHRKSIKVQSIPSFSLFEPKQVAALIQILRLAVLINNQRQLDLPLEAFKLSVCDKMTNCLSLTIDQQISEQHGLMLLDLEQEQNYWEPVKDWQLLVNVC
ncbi:exopolyphosphatase [Zophobihabitans entericus]|uniref:Exopolyphosphatase n=1 Tax=Zophobihabitans entericus TaxID=1635327 RepID=A0A6G9IE42_9GAMM|nr:exopolyphosphatase [Zophobihabitans entericus]QIQ22097.1 exopolyphosphatase [Zophobihabitans entericus]